MNFHKRKSNHESGIVLPLVALLDVIFFMLFYFMAAGSLSAPEAELPAAISADRKGPGGSSSDFTSQVLHVELEKGIQRFRLGQRAVSTRAELEAILSELPKAPGIIVRASDEVTIEGVAAALQAARISGFSKISYVAGE